MIETVLIIVAFSSVVAGLWLVWDLLNTIVWYWVAGRFPEEFEFYSPFFIKKVGFKRWSLVYDIGASLVYFGVVLLLVVAIGGV
ncbi:MAG: hypothetical protein QXS05_08475 [Candidatus Bathyarchaeia archaeon]